MAFLASASHSANRPSAYASMAFSISFLKASLCLAVGLTTFSVFVDFVAVTVSACSGFVKAYTLSTFTGFVAVTNSVWLGFVTVTIDLLLDVHQRPCDVVSLWNRLVEFV